jgi:hypothetical protein
MVMRVAALVSGAGWIEETQLIGLLLPRRMSLGLWRGQRAIHAAGGEEIRSKSS